MDDALAASYDPSGLYRSAIRTFQALRSGELTDISPSNPVISAIEMQCCLAGAFTETMQSETNRLLQVAATTKEDLYPHMADIHFTNIFNLPSSTVFTLVLEEREILAAMLPVPGTLSKKVTIPRNTFFTIGDYVFGIHYPIDIIQQVHQGLRITYDTSVTTPLDVLVKNKLDNRPVERDGIRYLAIDIPVHQFVITSKTPTVVSGKTFSFNVAIADLFYACRVYRTLANGTQEEIKVTYSEEIYDPLSPTAVVKLLDGTVNIQIPQIYINQGYIVGELRIDVYTTKGPLSTNFSSYNLGSIGYRFRDLNKNADTTYSAPLDKLGTCTILSERDVTGGVLAMTFEELRAAVIADGIGDPSLPITPAQIQNYLSRKGYDIIKNVDIVTDRVFLASRNMPDPTDSSLLTAANASIESMSSSFNELVMNSSVIDNDTSVTITPDAIYRLDSGILRMMSDSEMEAIRNMRSDLLAAHVTQNNYLYSPYHYVLDKANNQFRLTPYYLDNPSVDGLTYVTDNPGTLLSVNSNGYTLAKTASGYTLTISTSSSQEYQELSDSDVGVVLGFRSPTEQNICWIEGTLVGKNSSKERIFSFDLDSRFMMNASDRIDFRNFKMYDTTDKTIYSELIQDFSLIYTTTSQVGNLFVPGTMDAKLPRYLVPQTAKGIYEEKLTLNFGSALNNLWALARTVASATEYEVWPTDVILRYENDVFEKDPATGSTIIMKDGVPTRTKLHSAGDPILDSDGNEQIRFKKGTLKYDENNMPIPKGTRYLKQRFELFLIEGVYAFSNDDVAIAYRTQVAKMVANWVTQDLTQIEAATMDKSSAYFYPKTVFGTIDVVVVDGIVQQINAGQRFDVTLFVPKEVNDDDELKAQLKKQTISIISEYLKNRILTNSDIIKKLRDGYADDAIDVQVSLFGENADIPAMELVNEVHRCGIRKRLISRDDGKLVVEEDITVTFKTLT